MNALIISNIAIRKDAENRYCLNDLHKASGNNPKHKPSEWLRNQQTKELIAELENEAGNPASKNILSIIRGRGIQGTYAIKELVYAYAMWISAKFHIQVIRAYDALVTQSQPINLADVEKLIEQKMKANLLPIKALPQFPSVKVPVQCHFSLDDLAHILIKNGYKVSQA